MAAAQHGEPDQREKNGAGDADSEEWILRGGRDCGFAVLFRRERVIGNGEGLALFKISGGGKVTGEDFAVGVVGEANDEMLARRDAKGEGTACSEFVFAGGDVGCGF